MNRSRFRLISAAVVTTAGASKPFALGATRVLAVLCCTFLILAAFMPSADWAIGFLLARAALSQMDVPARQAYVMAVVPPEERAAAASVTNVPRSLATALSPLLAGALLANSDVGWPLAIAGGLKIVYDLLLLAQFRNRAEQP